MKQPIQASKPSSWSNVASAGARAASRSSGGRRELCEPAELTFALTVTNHTIVVSTNPNSRVALYYNHLRAFIAYEGEQITTEVVLPPFYQGHREANFLSAVQAERRYELSISRQKEEMLPILREEIQYMWEKKREEILSKLLEEIQYMSAKQPEFPILQEQIQYMWAEQAYCWRRHMSRCPPEVSTLGIYNNGEENVNYQH